ncbi:MAG TPA: hypothetical protein VM597_06465, partial [Gemmataceae bacterium]|nr:hypothetical protein [Gemmataceae bacterium]
MTPVEALLARCAREKVRVFLKSGGLGYETDVGISPALKAELRAHKAAVVAHLKRQAGDSGYTVVTDAGGLAAAQAGLEDCQGERLGLDTETTGLNFRADRVRL